MQQIEEFILMTVSHSESFFFFPVLLGSRLNKQHGFSNRYVGFLPAYLHKSISGGVCMNMSDLSKIYS